MPTLNKPELLGKEIMTVRAVSMKWTKSIDPCVRSNWQWQDLLEATEDSEAYWIRATFGPTDVTVKYGQHGLEASFTDPGLPLEIEVEWGSRLTRDLSQERLSGAKAEAIKKTLHREFTRQMGMQILMNIQGVSEDRMTLDVSICSIRLSEPLDEELSEGIRGIQEMDPKTEGPHW